MNSTIVAKHQIQWVSEQLKKDNPSKKLTHVIDRGSDDNDLFALINEVLQDHFVIRLLNKWINKSIVDAAIEEFKITPEQMKEIDRLALIGV